LTFFFKGSQEGALPSPNPLFFFLLRADFLHQAFALLSSSIGSSIFFVKEDKAFVKYFVRGVALLLLPRVRPLFRLFSFMGGEFNPVLPLRFLVLALKKNWRLRPSLHVSHAHGFYQEYFFPCGKVFFFRRARYVFPPFAVEIPPFFFFFLEGLLSFL